MNNYSSYAVGSLYPEFLRPEGCQFDMTDSGAIMILCYANPTEKEILEHKADKPLEIRLSRFDSTLILTAKFGSLPWVEFPYHPQLTTCTTMEDLEEGQGYAVQIFVANCVTGELKNIRLISLSTAFSKSLRNAHNSMLSAEFNPATYDSYLAALFKSYKTSDIAANSIARCKISLVS